MKLIRCIDFAFNSHLSKRIADSDSPASAGLSTVESYLQIDMALVAVVLATLFVLMKRRELLNCLSVSTIAEIYRVCLVCMVDSRLTQSPSSNSQLYLFQYAILTCFIK
jgi:hypothetical protein